MSTPALSVGSPADDGGPGRQTLPAALEPQERGQLSYEVRLAYRREPDSGAEVLFLEETFRNTGTGPVVFSTWFSQPYLKAIEPAGRVRKTHQAALHGRPPHPVATDVIRLAAGGHHLRKRWFLSTRTLPLASEKKDQVTSYSLIGAQAGLTLQICVGLVHEAGPLTGLLQKGEVLMGGTLCAPATRIAYRVLAED